MNDSEGRGNKRGYVNRDDFWERIVIEDIFVNTKQWQQCEKGEEVH